MPFSHKLCLAPMLDWTDRHFRYFIRLLSPHCFLYTEMITTGALLHGDASRFLSFHSLEHPLALQLGGSDPEALAQCARLADHYAYDEINLNVGCPSDRVQSGRFGACLMKEPSLVAECVAAMRENFSSLVSVKCRLGVDDQEDFSLLENFVDGIRAAGCDHLIVHARKAWLKGLSPKENRDIPPLKYDWVYRLKQVFPDFKIIINGGIKTVAEVLTHLDHVDGVMIGRPAYQDPYFFRQVEQALFTIPVSADPISDRLSILENYLLYIDEQQTKGVRLSRLARPLFGFFNGLSGARQWRQALSASVHDKDATSVVLPLHRTIFKFDE